MRTRQTLSLQRRDVNLQPEITSVVCGVGELKSKARNRDHVSLLTWAEDVAFLLSEEIYRIIRYNA